LEQRPRECMPDICWKSGVLKAVARTLYLDALSPICLTRSAISDGLFS
jgi:hypothetical protein